MSKIIARTNGAVCKAVGGAKVMTHGEGSNSMSVGATRNPTGGASVPMHPQSEAHNAKAMNMSQPPKTTGHSV